MINRVRKFSQLYSLAVGLLQRGGGAFCRAKKSEKFGSA